MYSSSARRVRPSSSDTFFSLVSLVVMSLVLQETQVLLAHRAFPTEPIVKVTLRPYHLLRGI
jgi:hypothetical protein